MLLYGASGHCKVVIDCLKDNNVTIKGIFDDDLNKSELSGIKVMGNYSGNFEAEEELIISIGNNQLRKIVANKVSHKPGKTFHPSVLISKSVSIDAGTVVFHGAIIQSYSKICKHVIINTGACIDHDCLLNDYAHISPNASLSGNVEVGEGTHIGTGAVIIQGIKIGKWCTVGAGSVIIRNIPDYAVVVGNPGKIIKYNSVQEFAK